MRSVWRASATVVAVVATTIPQPSNGGPATNLSGAMMGDTPFAVLWGLGSNGWYANPIEGGHPGGAGLTYDVSKYRITAFNRTGVGAAGGMAFAIDPGSFPQLGNPICEPLGTTPPTPACHNASDLRAYDPENGGVPQSPAANLSAHLRHVRGVFSSRIPRDFSGVCNIDFEGWQTNVWEMIFCDRGSSGNGTHWQEYTNGYQTFSTLLVKQQHPTWSIEKCVAEAKTQFESAATEWLVETLNVVKSLAPKCHWGYFAGPSLCAPYGPCEVIDGVMSCGYDHPVEGPKLRALAGKQRPVQEASTALFPAMYAVPSCIPGTTYERQGCQAALPNCTLNADMETTPSGARRTVFVNANCTLECGCCGEPNATTTEEYTQCGYNVMVPNRSIDTDRAWLRSVTTQAVRATNGKVPVIPFIWPYCEGGPCYEELAPPFANNATGMGGSHVSEAMIQSMIEVPYAAGAAATLFWVDRESVRPADGLLNLVGNVTGPATKSFIDKVDACGRANCSSHGRCMPIGSDHCECVAGWSGAKCERPNHT